MSKGKESKDSQVVVPQPSTKQRNSLSEWGACADRLAKASDVNGLRADLIICDDLIKEVPVKPPVNAVAVVTNLSVQVRAQKLEGFPCRKSIESVIGFALDTTSLHPREATAIVSMAYNTTLELIAQALEDSKD